jgi:hypothetical protein
MAQEPWKTDRYYVSAQNFAAPVREQLRFCQLLAATLPKGVGAV